MPPRKNKNSAQNTQSFENTFTGNSVDSRQKVSQRWNQLYQKLLEFSGITNSDETKEWATKTEEGIWECSIEEWKKRQGIDESMSIEESEYALDRDFWNIYILQNVYAYQNVDSQGSYGNPHLWNEIRTRKLDPYKVARMTPMERFPGRWAEVTAAKEAVDKYLYQTEEATSDLFRCMKCKQRKCTYTQAQLRAADEPMTTMVRCVNCGHSWRC